MDEPAVGGGPQGAAEELARSSGAVARLTALEPGQRIPEHIHDNPYLSLHLLGSYREAGEAGEVAIDGPAAALHPAGSAHADTIGERGLATVVIEFDPAWLRTALGGARLARSRYWIGGALGRRAGDLARAWLSAAPAQRRFSATCAFLAAAANEEPAAAAPAWVENVPGLLRASGGLRTADLAERLGMTPPWLARAYRQACGEGLRETLRRRRVEAAVRLLRETDLPLAQVAGEAGFCDQSHMNRAFRLLIGRTPRTVRAHGLPRLGLA